MNERDRIRAKRKRQAQVKRKMTILFITFLAIIASCFIVGLHNAKKATKLKIQLEKEDAQRLATAKKKLDDCYLSFSDSNKQGKQLFSDWILEHYFPDDQSKLLLELEKESFQTDTLHILTGESMHVLCDRYQGRITEDNYIFEKSGTTNDEVEITIAGDLCFAEDGFVLDYYDTVNDLKKCISPYLLELTNNSDLFYLNHEYCISDRGTPLSGKYYTFRAKPERMKLLKEMGVDLVALANNHVFDYGENALIDTTQLLTDADIPYVGGGINIEEAKRPLYFIVNGIKIGFVGASNAEKNRYTPQATETTAGILRAYDTTEYNEVIQKASKECDYLIAYIHWGTEDSNYLNNLQKQMGREFLNSGADIVVGGHPHVLQGMEYVDGKPIIYSLGDFWFNSETKYTGLLQLKLDKSGLKEMSFVPCLQTNLTTQYIEDPQKQEKLFQFIEDLSINISIDHSGVITEKALD